MTMIFNNILPIVLVIGLNASFVAIEYSLLTIRKTKVDQYVKQKKFGYFAVRKALDNLYMVISASQLGSTICNLVLGWFGEPMVERLIIVIIRMLPFKLSIFIDRSISVFITILILTFFQMILGEIIPKTIALQKSEAVSRILIAPLNLFTFIFSPLIFFINRISAFFLKIIHIRPLSKKPTDYSQEEIRLILDESVKNRIIPRHQAHLLANIFTLQNIPITKLMIKKSKLLGFFNHETIRQIRKKMLNREYAYNQYPIYVTDNQIIGYVHHSDIFRYPESKIHHLKIGETRFIREMLHIRENMPSDQVLLNMRKKQIHSAVITDRNEQLLGIVTLSDIIEFLIRNQSGNYQI